MTTGGLVDENDGAAMRPLRHTLSQLRLHELLVEVQDRVEQIVEGRDRLDGLVEAMLVVTAGLDLRQPYALSCIQRPALSMRAMALWRCTTGSIGYCTLSMKASTRRPFGGSATYRKA